MFNKVSVQAAKPIDLPGVLELMRQLAEFEGYIDQFNVTEQHLRENLFARKVLSVLVAKSDSHVLGMLVHYPLPFTYDCRPWWLLKELFVDSSARSCGVGKALLEALFRRARCAGVSRVRWEVLSSNQGAQKFYGSMGAQRRENWLPYEICIDR